MSVVGGDSCRHLAAIAEVIEADFDEMPGMRLTDAQAQRLWHLSREECQTALSQLCVMGRLSRDESGRYLRRST